MIEPQNNDGPSKLDQGTDAVQAATERAKETTRSVADAINAGRRSVSVAADRLLSADCVEKLGVEADRDR